MPCNTQSRQNIGWCGLCSLPTMKTISYTVVKEGRDYVNTIVVPENHSESTGTSAWGMVIAGGLLLVTATFICLLLLA